MRIGIDLGGTKIEVAALDLENKIVFRQRVPSPREDYAGTLRVVVDLVQAAAQQAGAELYTVGVGIPGALSPATGLVKNANSTWLIGQPLDKDLTEALGRQVRLSNDANCFALSEAVDGAAKGATIAFGVILGTGVGGGLIINGRPLEGANAIGGEWGHNPLPWPRQEDGPARPCYCGRDGCIETYLSGPGLASHHHLRNQTALKAEEILDAAENGDAQAEESLQRYESQLARALAHVINIADPEVIVLGGGLSNMARLYRNVPKLWAEHIFSDHVATRLLPPVHGDSSGVRGAAWLWNDLASAERLP